MRAWLVCPHCETKELIQQQTTFGVCPECGGGPRYAKDDAGNNVFVWTRFEDITKWDES